MLDVAIAVLEAELADLGVGKKFPADGSPEFLLAYAKSLGLSHLRRVKQAGVENSLGSVRGMYKTALRATKGLGDAIEAGIVEQIELL